MSIFKNKMASRAARKVKSFLDPNTGFVPDVTAGRRAKQQLASKNGEIAALKQELARVRGTESSPTPSLREAPMFFIVGNQKSGTTWLMKMLDAHPEILCWGEGRPFGRDFSKEERKGKKSGYPPTSLYNALANSEDLRNWIERSVWTKQDNVDEHIDNLMRLSIEYFLNRQLLKTTKRMVGDKTVLLNPQIVKEIGRVCPEARAIHIIRDGRDVAVSTTHHIWNQAEDRGGNVSMNSRQLAKREAYREDPRTLIESGEGIFPDGWIKKYAARWKARVERSSIDGSALLGDNYAEVRYESLIEKPEEEITRLLKFLGAEADEEKVSRCVGAGSFEKLSEGRKRGEEAASFYRKGIAGDWKNVFTERNKQEFKAGAGDLLIDLGYEKDNDW